MGEWDQEWNDGDGNGIMAMGSMLASHFIPNPLIWDWDHGTGNGMEPVMGESPWDGNRDKSLESPV